MKFKGTGAIALTDYKEITWTGKTKGGQACTIKVENALNMSNIDLNLVEKDDAVQQMVFTGTYDNTDETAISTEEPWEIEIDGIVQKGAAEILLGVGIVSIGGTDVALSRGGSKFTVTRDYREQNADGDRGPVKGRIELDRAVPTLTLNALTFLGSMDELFPAVQKVTE